MPINVPEFNGTGSPTRRNILLVGELGAGKSSFVNLVVSKAVVLADDGPRLCARQPPCYNVDIGPVQLALYDVPGLHESYDRMKAEELDILFQIYSFISQLESSGGISLLVYCLRAGRITLGIRQTYNLFVEVFRNGKVPVVIVVTHCEIHDRMEDWWEEMEMDIMKYGLHSIGHACITTTRGLSDVFLDKYEQSWETTKRLLQVDGLASRKDDNKRVALHLPKWLAARRTDRNFSELRKKLIKRCGYSFEDAEIIARRIDESRSLPPTTADEYKISTDRASLDTARSMYYSFADPDSDDEESENESGQIHGTAPSDQEWHPPCDDLTGNIKRTQEFYSACGAFADIWECELNIGTKPCKVAVKVVRVHALRGDGEHLVKLRRELEVWARLEHGNVVPLLGIVSGFSSLPSMVSPWFSNGTLTSYLENHQEMSLSQKYRLLYDIAAGLHYLHGKDVVHGDLHSGSVLIDDNGKASLSGFGLSVIIPEFVGTSYIQSSICGAVRYADPELVREVHYTTDALVYPTKPTDIYSFGSVTFHVLSGRKPFDGARELAVYHRVLAGERPTFPTDRPFSREHQTLIQRCWDPIFQRPSAAEIVASL